jgi:ABC-type multidrug transport system ATPase subunit
MLELRIEGLSKTYPNGVKALQDVSLTIPTGMFGLLGPNGAGKSTLMRTIATLQEADAGSITLGDIDVLREKDKVRRLLGYLPQEFGVYPRITAEAMLNHFAVLKGIGNPKERREIVGALLRRTNLHESRKQNLSTFSGGMRQRFGIAQALLGNPKLIIVDEPTAGLDPEERVRFRNVLADAGLGKLVILSTHIVSDVESVATHIAIMNGGAIVACDTPEALMRGAEGSVWELVVPSERFDELRRTARVSSAVRKSDGVHVRIVSAEEPRGGANAAEPTLEDAFLHTMGVRAAA